MIKFSILPEIDEWRPAKLNLMGDGGGDGGDGGNGDGGDGDGGDGGDGGYGQGDSSGGDPGGLAGAESGWSSGDPGGLAGAESGWAGGDPGGLSGATSGWAGGDPGGLAGATSGDFSGDGSIGGGDYGSYGGFSGSSGDGSIGGGDYGSYAGDGGGFATGGWATGEFGSPGWGFGNFGTAFGGPQGPYGGTYGADPMGGYYGASEGPGVGWASGFGSPGYGYGLGGALGGVQGFHGFEGPYGEFGNPDVDSWAAPAAQGWGAPGMAATTGITGLEGGPAGYGYGAGWGGSTGVGPGGAFGGAYGDPGAVGWAGGPGGPGSPGGFGAYGAPGGVGLGTVGGPTGTGVGWEGLGTPGWSPGAIGAPDAMGRGNVDTADIAGLAVAAPAVVAGLIGGPTTAAVTAAHLGLGTLGLAHAPETVPGYRGPEAIDVELAPVEPAPVELAPVEVTAKEAPEKDVEAPTSWAAAVADAMADAPEGATVSGAPGGISGPGISSAPDAPDAPDAAAAPDAAPGAPSGAPGVDEAGMVGFAPGAPDVGIFSGMPGAEIAGQAQAGIPATGQPGQVGLAVARADAINDLQKNPALRDKLTRLAYSEVGTNKDAVNKFVETVLNRAAAEDRSMDDVLAGRFGTTNVGYYPGTPGRMATREARSAIPARANAPMGIIGPIVDDAIANASIGSNFAGLATGNASGRMGTGTVTATSGRGRGAERFGIEGFASHRDFANAIRGERDVGTNALAGQFGDMASAFYGAAPTAAPTATALAPTALAGRGVGPEGALGPIPGIGSAVGAFGPFAGQGIAGGWPGALTAQGAVPGTIGAGGAPTSAVAALAPPAVSPPPTTAVPPPSPTVAAPPPTAAVAPPAIKAVSPVIKAAQAVSAASIARGFSPELAQTAAIAAHQVVAAGVAKGKEAIAELTSRGVPTKEARAMVNAVEARSISTVLEAKGIPAKEARAMAVSALEAKGVTAKEARASVNLGDAKAGIVNALSTQGYPAFLTSGPIDNAVEASVQSAVNAAAVPPSAKTVAALMLSIETPSIGTPGIALSPGEPSWGWDNNNVGAQSFDEVGFAPDEAWEAPPATPYADWPANPLAEAPPAYTSWPSTPFAESPPPQPPPPPVEPSPASIAAPDNFAPDVSGVPVASIDDVVSGALASGEIFFNPVTGMFHSAATGEPVLVPPSMGGGGIYA